ncbi:HNH endonuclease [Pseudomonas sp.]|uniref:HNH endonuclease n=1 Tax=Pseudomonas sp. TaxID=306 RepID=UPI003FD78738
MSKRTNAYHQMPPRGELLEYLEIDAQSPSGLTRVKPSCGRNGKIGPVVSLDREGYYRTKFKNIHYRTHRIIFYLHTDEDPGQLVVDHIDGNRANNTVDNLRACTHQENLQNARKRGKGDLPKGITKLADGCFRSQVTVDDVVLKVEWDSLESAMCYLDQIRKDNHGEFARN